MYFIFLITSRLDMFPCLSSACSPSRQILSSKAGTPVLQTLMCHDMMKVYIVVVATETSHAP